MGDWKKPFLIQPISKVLSMIWT
ncbi:MAG: hypothetical protein ACQZ3N_04065 [cyanobacterium endosymbiont of Rhopalodia yunnanensis]